MTADEIIRAFDRITPRKAFPPGAHYQVIDGTPGSGDTDWSGQLVCRVSDVLTVLGVLVRQVDREHGVVTVRDRRDGTIRSYR